MNRKQSEKVTPEKLKKSPKGSWSNASVSAAPSRNTVAEPAASTKKSKRSRKRKGKLRADMPRKVIVDTDPGTDDAMAILMLLRDPNIQVLAITVTQGNATLEDTSRNTLRIVNVAKRKDVS